jgi:hypothetical protein
VLDATKLAPERVENRQRGKAAVGDHERARASGADELRCDVAARAGAEHDRRRKGEAMEGWRAQMISK